MRTGATYTVASKYVCYTQDVREKEFINKVHKHLPKEIYRWKINDPYHGGVPDTYYAGSTGFCFIEYKYQDTLPRKDTSKIQIHLSTQQRLWLKQQHEFNIPVYVVLGSQDRVYTTQNFDLPHITLKEFRKNSILFTEYMQNLTNILIGGKNDGLC